MNKDKLIRRRIQEIEKHYQKGHYKRAAVLCDSVITIDPENEVANIIRFRCISDSLQPDKLFTETTRLVEMFPQSADAWMFQGVSYGKAQKVSEAEAAYRRCLELNPENYQALHNLGSILTIYGDRTEGISLIEKSVSLEPSYEAGHGTLAQIYYSDGRFAESIREAELSGDLINGYQELVIAYGDSLYQTGQYTRSRAVFSRLVEETLLSSPMYAMLCPLLRESDQYDHTGGLTDLDGDHIAATYYRAFLSLNPGSDTQPISSSDLDLVLASNPSHAYALSGLASLHKLKKDIAGSLPFIEQAIVADPSNLSFIRQKAFILYDEDPNASLALFEELLAKTPGDIESALGKAWALKGLGRDEESLALLHELTEKDPSFIHGLMGMPTGKPSL